MELTVIIPIWNKKPYLPALLEDVRGQTFPDFECLLIDDGSDDGCGALCDAAAALDARFRVFHIPNGGVSHARNVGLDAARGDYITFLDSDDRIENTYLARLMDLARRSGAELVISGFDKVRPDGTVVCQVTPRRTGLWHFDSLLPDFCAEQRGSGIYGYAFGKLFPRRVLGEIRFDEDLHLAEDFDFYLRLYEKLGTVYLDGGAGYQYLVDAENGTAHTPSHRIDYLAQLRIHLRWRELLRRRGADTGENRRILQALLEDYAFFVLFHTPKEQYRERFSALYDLSRREKLVLRGGKLPRRWLFFCLRHGLRAAAKGSMDGYRAIRRGLGRPCC